MLSLLFGFLGGLAVLGILWLVATVTGRHGVLTWGVSVVVFGSLLLLSRFVLPLWGTPGYRPRSTFDLEPAPLVAPALVVSAFAVPSLVFAVLDFAGVL